MGRTSGRTFVADTGHHVIRDVIPSRPAVVFAGALDVPGNVDGPVAQARFNNPTGLSYLEQTDTLYVADTGNHTIRKIQNGIVTTIAGLGGIPGSADGMGSAARFNEPRGVDAVYYYDTQVTTVLVADTGNHTIRKISQDGVVTTIAGLAGVSGSADGVGRAARFNRPWGIAGEYVTDSGNHTIRYLSLYSQDGVINVRTAMGLAGVPGSADGEGSAARFNTPTGIACCAELTLYVTDTGNHTVRLFAGGQVSTMGGSAGIAGFTEGVGSNARFRSPTAVAIDNSWDFHVADTGNNAISVGTLGTPRSAPTIRTAPLDKKVPVGIWAYFYCGSSGSPIPANEWEQSPDGVTWERLSGGASYSGVRSESLGVKASYALHNWRFRCVATNEHGSAVSPPATLTVTGSVTPASLRFAATRTAAGTFLTTPPQVVTLHWGPVPPSTWSVSTNQSWILINGSRNTSSGTDDGSFTVAIDPTQAPVSAGKLNTVVVVSTYGDDSRSFWVPVELTMIPSSASAPAFGVIDTPADNAAGLDGAIPITGWALDDIAVSRVEIWRDRVAGETTPVTVGGAGNGKIFIANATFVPGVRPDVESIFSGVPLASNGGWGYMLLTQGLYNQGNGTYRLHAFAYDVDGHVTTLGSRTITVDNAHATRPFGTVDIPSYGGTVSGVVQGFGWALTPGFCTIQNPDVQMSVDSGPLVQVMYGDARSDIAGMFPGYSNASAAGGHFTLDTTQLSNGLHTISWVVTDTCGRSAGLGSRFFTVDNK